jgi:hypothetical protein
MQAKLCLHAEQHTGCGRCAGDRRPPRVRLHETTHVQRTRTLKVTMTVPNPFVAKHLNCPASDDVTSRTRSVSTTADAAAACWRVAAAAAAVLLAPADDDGDDEDDTSRYRSSQPLFILCSSFVHSTSSVESASTGHTSRRVPPSLTVMPLLVAVHFPFRRPCDVKVSHAYTNYLHHNEFGSSSYNTHGIMFAIFYASHGTGNSPS